MTKENINFQDNFGRTAFHSACVTNHIDIVQLLLNDERVDVNILDNSKQTALALVDIGVRRKMRNMFDKIFNKL